MKNDNRLPNILTYFGLKIHKDYFVLEDDIKKLPFYDFWLESSKGSNLKIDDNKTFIHLADWQNFSRSFIKYGTHRFE